MCEVFSVSRSGYYDFINRPKSKRQLQDEQLSQHIETIHEQSDGTYGAIRIHQALRHKGIRHGKKRIARLMKQRGLKGVSRRKFVTTTVRDYSHQSAPDLVLRKFEADRPNKLWVADITYLPSKEGFAYLSAVLDVFSRKIVGWSLRDDLQKQGVLDALQMAVEQRQVSGVIHHSDQGSQYTSYEFGKRCQKAGVIQSTGSVGDCYDNAMCESFFASLECELLARYRFETKQQVKQAVFRYIEGWYNPHRLHSALDYHSPNHFEQLFWSAVL